MYNYSQAVNKVNAFFELYNVKEMACRHAVSVATVLAIYNWLVSRVKQGHTVYGSLLALAKALEKGTYTTDNFTLAPDDIRELARFAKHRY